jgi:hypothetical protein
VYRKAAFLNVMSEKFYSVNIDRINTDKIGVCDFFRCRVCQLSVTLDTQLIVYSLCKLLSFIRPDFDEHHFSFDVDVLWLYPILIATFLMCILFIFWWHSVHHIACRIINQSDSLWLVTV